MLSMLIFSVPADWYIQNYYQDDEKEQKDEIMEVKVQMIEKMLECHRIAITTLYPANRDNGKN
jgi:hypothetical protein